MSASLKLVALGLALLVCQAMLASVLPPLLRPDLILIFALAMGLRASGTQGLVLAFGLGFAFDVLSGSPPGLYALLRGTACALTRVLDRALYLRAAAPWAIFAAAYAMVDWLLLGAVLRFAAPEAAAPWGELWVRVPLAALLAAPLAAALLPLFRRLDSEAEGDAGFTLPASSGSRVRS